MIPNAWKQRARQLKTDTYALYLACRDPRVPWYAKLLAACIVGYAFSPIDLIPDFVPIFGYLDDLLLIPLGIALVVRLVPGPVMAECRVRSQEVMAQGKPNSRVAAVLILGIWLIAAALGIVIAARALGY
jgi:uncharacterized membrane protein YkvA (DUF1232 family)